MTQLSEVDKLKNEIWRRYKPKTARSFSIANKKQGARINQSITAPKLRLIDAQGNQVGILSRDEALAKAEEAGLDLVEISPAAQPPVAKIIDWDKYRYEQTKQARQAKKKHRVQAIKQMRFGLKIGQHDLDVKLRKVKQFLENGDKVKISVVFKGREMAHPEIGKLLVERITDQLDDVEIDQTPQMVGRFLQFVVRKK